MNEVNDQTLRGVFRKLSYRDHFEEERQYIDTFEAFGDRIRDRVFGFDTWMFKHFPSIHSDTFFDPHFMLKNEEPEWRTSGLQWFFIAKIFGHTHPWLRAEVLNAHEEAYGPVEEGCDCCGEPINALNSTWSLCDNCNFRFETQREQEDPNAIRSRVL